MAGETRADVSGIERELASLNVHLGRIAESLATLVELQKAGTAPSSHSETVAEAPEPAAAPAAAAGTPAPPAPPAPQRVSEREEPGGHRRLHTLPKVRGQRGKRPD
ncbi:MAG TPA: hypothetical protein VIA62_11310 [Thermoanaerobaculia bacterium]|nr:hypothetical protein [Thermoanaerobaculia bacterium]